MKTKISLWEDQEIVDTKKLQIFSLCQFMKSFHYSLAEYSGNFSRFESAHPTNKGRSILSWNKAISLYNSDSIKCVFGKPPSYLSLWSFSDYQVTQAKAARITRKVKLQFCKDTNQIIVQDHRVQFICSSYKNQFLNNKYIG